LLLTIDAGGAVRSAIEAVRWLAQSLEDLALPATWGIDAAEWQHARRLCCATATEDSQDAGCQADGTVGSASCDVQPVDGAAPAHAFAVCMGEAQVQAARAGLAAELAAMRQAAERAGCRPQALLLRGNRIPSHLDLLAQAGIRAIALQHGDRGASGPVWRRLASLWAQAQGASTHARLLRHGVWELPATLVSPGAGWRAADAALERCLRHGNLLHVIVSAAALGRSSARAELAQLLACLALRREQGALAVDTLPGYVAHLTAPRASQPARSILRPNAA
jgi:hypothetical protein